MHSYPLLEILAAGFGAALLFGYIAHRLHLSPLVGYLVAGFLVGPQTPGLVVDMALAHELSEAGVILLMFGVGLHFNLSDLLAVKRVALPGALVQIAAATTLGACAGLAFGMSLPAGLMLGLGLSVASTVVLLRVLSDAKVVNTIHGHVAIGWLVVEDIFTVLVLVLLPSLAVLLAGESGGAGSMLAAFGLALVRLIALWVLVLVVGGKVVPWLLIKVVRTRSQELFTLTVLVAAFATAVGAAVFFQASMALGAFLGGMVVGKTKLSHQAGADLLPLKDAFAVLFFLSVGMLFDPVFLVKQPLLALSCLGIVLIAKPLTALVVVSLLGYSARTALTVALGLAQVGEFSFILAQQAQALGMIPGDVYSVLVICALISITLNPGAFRQILRIETRLRSHPRLWRLMNSRADARAAKGNAEHLAAPDPEDAPGEGEEIALVIGYGPTGQSVTEALRAKGVTPVIIDMNVDTVNALTDRGAWAIFGDAERREVLLAAGVEKALYLIITVPVLESTLATAALAKSMNPAIRVLARARFLEERDLLRRAGVTGIAFEEAEVAASLANLALNYVSLCEDGACPAAEDAPELREPRRFPASPS